MNESLTPGSSNLLNVGLNITIYTVVVTTARVLNAEAMSCAVQNLKIYREILQSTIVAFVGRRLTFQARVRVPATSSFWLN